MTSKNFYVLQTAESSTQTPEGGLVFSTDTVPLQKRLAKWGEYTHYKQGTDCKGCGRLLKILERNGPLSVELPSRQVPDINETWYSEILIPERTIELFKREGLTGFRLLPVTIEGIMRYKGTEFPKLWELDIIGKGGEELPGRSYAPKCPVCNRARRLHDRPGIFVDPNNWDGSDFFRVKTFPGIKLISKRAMEVIVKANLRHCCIYEAEKLPLS